MVSYFNHLNTLHELYQWQGNWETFFDAFVKGTLPYGSYFNHVKHWMQAAGIVTAQIQVCYVGYEELMYELRETVCRVMDFVGVDTTLSIREDILDRVCRECTLQGTRKFVQRQVQDVVSSMKVDDAHLTSKQKGSVVDLVTRESTRTSFVEVFTRRGRVGDGKRELSEIENQQIDELCETHLKDMECAQVWTKYGVL